jgi:hypothetical protein
VDLLRVCGTAAGACLTTEAAEWVAVGLGRHRVAWTVVTAWQVAGPAVLTTATIGVAVLLFRAARRVAGVAQVGTQPDWLADAVTLGLDVFRLPGRYRRWVETLVRWADAQVIARVRANPLSSAALLGVLLALPFVAAKLVLEGYPAALLLLVFAFATASLFTFVVIVGAYVRVVAPREGGRPAWLILTLVACTTGAAAFAFHDSLLAHQSVATVSALFFIPGLAAGSLSFATEAAFRFVRAHQLAG